MSHPVRLRHFLDGPWPDRSAVLADLDGCLVSGVAVLPDVPELFERCGSRLWIVSNNSSDTAQSLSAQLAGLGLPLPADRILLAGEMTLRALQVAHPGARIALYAADPLERLALGLGLRLDRDRPDAVVLARDLSIDFADIARIAAFAHEGLTVTLANPDRSHPAVDGTPVPETGALWAAVNAIVPCARMSSLGKPAPYLPREALRRAGVAPEAAVFIGDTAETDGVAAAACGVEFVQLTRPGEALTHTPVAGACTC